MNSRLNRLSRIMYVLLVIFAAVVPIIAMQGCVSNMDGHDPVATAQDAARNITTDKPASTAAQDWYYFVRDVLHGDHD